MTNDTMTTIKRAARKLAGAANSTPVEITSGSDAPRLAGESWHYETRGGRRVYHPSAYRRHGWSNLVYIHSTRRVIVGAEWQGSAA